MQCSNDQGQPTIGVRANIHLGGQTEFCPNGFGGGGVVAEIFRDPYSVGGGSRRHFPGSMRARFGGGVVAEFFPLTAVTCPKFVLFNHVLCFARIMSTLCPDYCRQTARIGGQLPSPLPPSRTPMEPTTVLGLPTSMQDW